MTIKIRDIVSEVVRLLRAENIPFSVQDIVMVASGAVSDLTNLKPVLVRRFWFNSKLYKQRYWLPPEVRQVLSVWYKPANASFVVGTQDNPKAFLVVGDSNWAGWDDKGELVWYVKSGQLASPKPYKVKFSKTAFTTTSSLEKTAVDFNNLWRSRPPKDAEGIPFRTRCGGFVDADDFERSIGGYTGDAFPPYYLLYIDPQFDIIYQSPPFDFFAFEGTIVEEDKGWIELEPIGSEAYFPSNALTDSPVLENLRGYGVFGNVLVIQYPIRKHGYKNIMVEAVCHFPIDIECVSLDTDTGLNPRFLRLLVVMTLRRVLEATVGSAASDWIGQLIAEESRLMEGIPSEVHYINQSGYGASILPYRAGHYKPSTENHEEWDFQRLGYWKPSFRWRSFIHNNPTTFSSSWQYMPVVVHLKDGGKQDTVAGVRQVGMLKEMSFLWNMGIKGDEVLEIHVPERYLLWFPITATVRIDGYDIPVRPSLRLSEERRMRLWF